MACSAKSDIYSAFFILLNALLFAASSYWDNAPISPQEVARATVPIPCHSHNDYWRKVPVLSALHVGCIGIEADVWLDDDELFVGHDEGSLRPERTFTGLYVDQLARILLQQNGNSSLDRSGSYRGVYDLSPNQTLVLLIDLKTDSDKTWPVVLRQLAPLRERNWLSYFQNGTVHYRPVTVVGTGNTRFDMVTDNTTYRDAFFDAPLDRLSDSPYNTTNSYYTSVSFKQSIGIVRYGDVSSTQISKIREQVTEAHARGLKVRYWELPAWPVSVRNHVWEVLMREGVDILNVDDLRGAKKFLGKTGRTHDPQH
jgi:hypothetical protein